MIMARVDITLAKVAILLLYLRIFVPRQTGSRKMWLWIWFMVVFNVVYCLVLILLIQLQCVGHKIPQANGSCLNQQVCRNTWIVWHLLTTEARSHNCLCHQRDYRSRHPDSRHCRCLGTSHATVQEDRHRSNIEFWISVRRAASRCVRSMQLTDTVALASAWSVFCGNRSRRTRIQPCTTWLSSCWRMCPPLFPRKRLWIAN